MSTRVLRLSACAAFMLVATAASAQDALRWETDLATAQRVAAQTNRLVLVHFWGTWCPPCMKMEQEVFSKPGLGTALTPYYVPVKVQVEQGMNQDLVAKFAVDGFPCDIIMTPQGQMVHRSKGFQPADQYVAMLNQVAHTALAPQTPVAANSAGQPTSSTPAPVAQAPVAQPPVASPVSAVMPADDRYASYYRDRAGAAAAPVTPPSSVTTPAAPQVSAPVAAAAPAPTTSGPAASSLVGDRYATSAPAAAPPMTQPSAPAYTPPPVVAAPPSAPPVAAAAPAAPQVAQPVAPPVVAQPPVAAAPPTVNPQAAAPASVQLPPGCPPLALDGYCPVTVTEKMAWKKGDVHFGAIHRDRTYLFASAADQKKFLENPDRYSPVISGNDPVVALERNQLIAGKREYGVMYQDRMFLFADKASCEKFKTDSKRYAGAIFHAMQADDLKRR